VTSAASIFKHIDRNKYEPIAIRIEKSGGWTLPKEEPTALSAAEVIQKARAASATGENLGGGEPAVLTSLGVDAVFPILHGPYGEDGTVQGLLELANIPYVGAGVLASAAGMDKAVMKILFAGRRLPVCAWHGFVRAEWDRDRRSVLDQIARLGLPVFVKPANLGSSVGISKVKTGAELGPAIETALAFDRKVVVEAAVPNAREIECAVLGNHDPETSIPGEIIPSREFYDYEAKYLDEGSKSVIPADRPRRFPAGPRQRRDLPERDQHHAWLHDDQHVFEDVGSVGRGVWNARRSADPAWPRAARGKATTED